MRHLILAVLAMGMSAITAAAQTPLPNIPLNQPPRQQIPELPDGTHREPLAPGKLDLIGMPIAPPPVTAWVVGEPVTEFEPGKVYVFFMYVKMLTFPSSTFREDVRHFLGGMQDKYGDRVVVVEIVHEDGRNRNLEGNVSDSLAKNTDVRTHIGVCENSKFKEWCRSKGLGSTGTVISGDGRLAAIIEHHASAPRIIDSMLAGDFDAQTDHDLRDAARQISTRKPMPATPEERLARMDEIAAAFPGSDLGLGRADALRALGRPDLAAAELRQSLDAMSIVDRDWLRMCREIASPPIGGTDALTPIALEAAQVLAATSGHKRAQELRDVVRLARTMRDYETAITYQTMIVALAKTELDQYSETRELRELEEEAAGK